MNFDATSESASSHVAGSNSPVSWFLMSGVRRRSGAFTKSKLAERPFTHSRPWFDGPSAGSTSTMRLPFIFRYSWQPVAQCGQLVRTFRTSHSR